MTAVVMTAMLVIGLDQSAGAATSVGSTSRASVSSAGVQGSRNSDEPAMSDTGRYVVFTSLARNLVADDTNLVSDIFVRDRVAGTTRRVSVGARGRQANGASIIPSISGDGRYVAFLSDATNLVAGDTNNASDIFVHDVVANTTRRVSVGPAGHQANGASTFSAISRDGRHVVFDSAGSNLVAGDTNGTFDIFVRDLPSATTHRVSVSSAGAQGDAASLFPAVSGNGRFVAFISEATNLVADDDNDFRDVFVRDRKTGVTRRASVGPGGVQADSISTNRPSISANGRFVAFDSSASNLVAGDTNGVQDIFVRDLQLATTSRVSVGVGGVDPDSISISPKLSSTGRFVSFESVATNLVLGDTNGLSDVFLSDRSTGTTRRVSVGPGGVQGNGNSLESAISGDGRHVAYSSAATNLVAGDTNRVMDVFVRD